MGRIDVFVAPRPNPALINVMTIVSRIVMLRGICRSTGSPACAVSPMSATSTFPPPTSNG